MLDPLREHALRPAQLVERLKIPKTAVVADLGAGPGFLTLPLSRAATKVLATDVRADYLETLRSRAAAAGVANVETRVVAADDPGLAPSSVDVAVVCQVDHYLVDRTAWLSKVARGLKPGGRIAVVNYVRHRAPLLEAARAAGLRVVDEWSPSPPFHLTVLAK
jgi:ubiquinone/menaquinone biosynthesis C-methylase UbiE